MESYLNLPNKNRIMLFIGISLVFLLTFGAISAISAPLANSTAQFGILSFQLAGNPERAQEIIVSWDDAVQRYAAFSLGFDYLFMLVYACFFSIASLESGRMLQQDRLPLYTAGAFWAAMVLDALENVGLGLVLLKAAGSPWPEFAYGCAVAKYILIFLGLVYVFFGLTLWLTDRLISRKRPAAQ